MKHLPIPRLLFDFIMLALGVLGAVFCFITTFSIVVHTTRLLFLGLLFCLCMALLLRVQKRVRYLFAAGMLAAVAIYFFINKAALTDEALSVWYRMLTIALDALGRAAPSLPAALPANWQTMDATRLFLCAVLLYSMLVAFVALVDHSFLLCFICTLFFMFIPLFITITPAWLPLMAVLVFWVVMLLVNTLQSRFQASVHKAGFIALPIVVLLSVALSAAVPENAYTRDPRADALRERMMIWDFNESTRVLTDFSSFAKAGQLDFRTTGNRTYNGTIMLRLVDAQRAEHYLRGNTGSVYTGGGWASLPDSIYTAFEAATKTPMMNLTGYGSTQSRDITLTYERANTRLLYVPYVLASPPEALPDATFLHDIAIEKDRSAKEVTLRIVDPATSTIVENPSLDAYGHFVRAYYLQIPDALREELLAFMGDVGVHGASQKDAIEAIRMLLHQNTSYTLTPGKTPASEDFVKYFLFKNQEGYCIHYATAAVMMLRALDIPARYADGYVVRPSNYDAHNTAAIPDRQAHAWVEVFEDGLGWAPVEFTPSDWIEANEAGPVAVPSPLVNAPQSTPTPQPPPAALPAAPGDPGQQHPINSNAGQKAVLPLLVVGGFLLLLISGYFLYRHCIHSRRRAAFSAPDVNARAIAMYKYITAFAAFGMEPDLQVTALAYKAAYSQHVLQEDELAIISQCANSLPVQAYQKQSFLGKLRMRLCCLR